jgi:selenocysteine-specific elongation factor
MHVLATAGHVDHGKSTLVRALTGMEPDRWAEERRRGMTIDLGYAWTGLPSGADLAFVDVPGHERFIGNMLAGLGPAPGVLFVVAADEGWARQSEEHLAAVDALGLQHGLLVITRTDLADPTDARAESLDRIRRSSLGDVEAVAVCAPTGTGLPALRSALERLVSTLPEPDLAARVRLWVDRAFIVRGSGTVVTGTLGAGSIGAGDALVLRSRTVVVRSIQSMNRPVEHVDAVARVALNLRGVAAGDVGRGDVLLAPGEWHRTAVVDARLTTDARLPPGLLLHLGTASLPVRVRPLDGRIARLTLPEPLPLLPGDRAVLRDPGRHAVVAGVLVLDSDPPPLTRRGAARQRGAALESAGATPDPHTEIARRGAVRRDHLAALGIDAVAGLHDEAGWLVNPDTWQRWVDAAPRVVAGWAAANPVDPQMPLGALARSLQLPDPALLRAVLADTDLLVDRGRVAHTVPASLGPTEQAVRQLETRLHERPFAAPERTELAELRLGRRELAAAEKAGRLLRIDDDIVLLPTAPDLAAAALARLPQPFTTSAARQALGTTRRVAIPVLEHLDRTGRTERVDPRHRRVIDGAAQRG